MDYSIFLQRGVTPDLIESALEVFILSANIYSTKASVKAVLKKGKSSSD